MDRRNLDSKKKYNFKQIRKVFFYILIQLLIH